MSANPSGKKKQALKSYGRQGEGKTIKSLSLDKELVKEAERRAKAQGVSFSQFMNALLARESGLNVAEAEVASPTVAPKTTARKAAKKATKKKA